MKKLTVYGELCLEDGAGGEWYADVELDDEQSRNLMKLIMFAGGDTDVKNIGLKEAFPDIYDILDKACYRATLDAYNKYLRDCGKSEVEKLDFEHEVNIPLELMLLLKVSYYSKK